MIDEKVLKNTAWNSIGMTVYFACQWLITLIVVWLSDDFTNNGYLGLAMTVTNFIYVVAAYNNRSFQVSDIRGEYNDSEFVVARGISCAASVVISVAFVLIVDFTAMQRAVILCYTLFRVNEAFIDVLHGIDQKSWRMDFIGISMIIRGIVMLAAFTLLLWAFGLLYAIIGMFVSTFLVNILFDVQKTKKLANFTAYAMDKVFSILKRCFPLMMVLLISTTIATFARISIERVYGTEALGIYSAASNLPMLLQVSISFLFAPMINLLAEALKDADKKRFTLLFMGTFAIIGVITLIFTVGSHFFGQWALGLLFGEEIVPYSDLMTYASIVAGVTASVWFLNVVFSAIRDMKGILVCVIIGMVICFAASDLLLREYGLQGANYVMIISQGAAALCALVRFLWVMKRRAHEYFIHM